MELKKFVVLMKTMTILLTVLYFWMAFVVETPHSLAVGLLTIVAAAMFFFFNKKLKEQMIKEKEREERRQATKKGY